MHSSQKFRFAFGPILTLIAGLLFIGLAREGIILPENEFVLFTIVVFSGFYSGVGSGICAMGVGFFIFGVTTLFPRTFPPFSGHNWQESLTLAVLLPWIVLMVSLLRRKLDERVKESEEGYRMIMENVEDVFLLISIDLRTLFFISPNCMSLLGRSQAEFIAHPETLIAAVHPDDHAAFVSYRDAVMNGSWPIHTSPKPLRAIRKDGSLRWLAPRAVIVRDANGTPTHFASSIRDVTKEVEEAAEAESRERTFRAIVENSWDAIVVTDTKGNASYVSPSIAHMLGYTSSELLNANPFVLIHPDDAEGVKDRGRILTLTPERHMTSQLRMRHKDGTWHWVEITSTGMVKVPGLEGVISNIRDVGDAKRVEEEERRIYENFRAILNNAPVAIFATDKDGILTLREGRGGARAGVKQGQGIGESYFEQFKDVPEHIDNVRRALRGDAFTQRLRVRAGFYEIAYSPVRSADGLVDGMVGVATDITEREHAETESKQLSALKNKFITVVSHQLRTPLSAARWNLESLMNDELGVMKPEQKEFLRLTYAANSEVINRISDFLLALDIEEGRVVISKEQVSLESLWQSVMIGVLKRCQHSGTTCVYEPAETPLPSVKADPEKIRVVLEKLADNAVIYSPGGKVTAELTASASAVRFSITDNGIGIPTAEQPRIFSSFYRASNASPIDTDASGLGLYIARHFIEQHGGKIGFTSKEGKGSTFWFELPIGA